MYDRMSSALEMRAARLAVLNTLERLDMLHALPTVEVSNIAQESCEQATASPTALYVEVVQ